MFNRDTRAEPRAEIPRARFSGPTGIVPNSASPMFETGAQERPTSILGPDISIFGQQLVLKTKGSLLIQGQIQGDVHGESVTVDDGANVTGVITARTIAIQGGVRGELKGSSVILHEHSIVDANIIQQRLTIAEGAQFEGSVKKASDISEVTPDLS
jgi:cytoskeletal protein CcmA (bactofilin family)